jgi:hypothetical protein
MNDEFVTGLFLLLCFIVFLFSGFYNLFNGFVPSGVLCLLFAWFVYKVLTAPD